MVLFNAFTKLLSFFFVRVYMFFKFKSNAPQCKGHPTQKGAELQKKKKKRNETNQKKRDKNKQTTKTVDAYAFGNMFFNFLLMEKVETFCCTFIEANQ